MLFQRRNEAKDRKREGITGTDKRVPPYQRAGFFLGKSMEQHGSNGIPWPNPMGSHKLLSILRRMWEENRMRDAGRASRVEGESGRRIGWRPGMDERV